MWKKQRAQEQTRVDEVGLTDELAWRVHENAKGWIVQVDVKSAAALAIEAAILGFALNLITNSDSPIHLTSLSRWALGIGIFFLLSSVVFSALVLFPKVRLREPAPEDRGYLYFGHLRHWNKKDLSKALNRNRVDNDELSDQVIKMSAIAWKKHALLQVSLYLLVAGVFVIGVLYLLFIVGFFPDQIGQFSVDLKSGSGH